MAGVGFERDVGHADRAVALAIALLAARDIKPMPNIRIFDWDAATPEELAEMAIDDPETFPWEQRAPVDDPDWF